MFKWLSVVLFILAACEDSNPCNSPGATRCRDNAVEECVGGQWRVEDNCNEVNMLDNTIEAWECCQNLTGCRPSCEE